MKCREIPYSNTFGMPWDPYQDAFGIPSRDSYSNAFGMQGDPYEKTSKSLGIPFRMPLEFLGLPIEMHRNPQGFIFRL